MWGDNGNNVPPKKPSKKDNIYLAILIAATIALMIAYFTVK